MKTIQRLGMNKFVGALIALLFSTSLLAQKDSNTVAFISHWSVGDSYNFKITKTNQIWKMDSLKKDWTQAYTANFLVIDSTADSYTIKWSYQNDLGNTYQIPARLQEKFSQYSLTEIKYKTNQFGTFTEILNWKEVSDMMNNLFDDMVEILGEEDKANKDLLKTSLAPFKQIYSSKQGVEGIVLKELQFFHMLLGIEFNTAEPIYYDDELPNVFGGKPIKAKAKLYFEKVDKEEHFCIVKQESSLDPDDTKDLIKKLKDILKLDDADFEKAMRTAVFTVDDKRRFEYFYNPGIPHKIESIRESVISFDKEQGRTIDKTLIELIYNE